MTPLKPYRGIGGAYDFSEADGVYYGRLDVRPHLVTFEALRLRQVKRAFRAAVDGWLGERGRGLTKGQL